MRPFYKLQQLRLLGLPVTKCVPSYNAGITERVIHVYKLLVILWEIIINIMLVTIY